jgi:pSer/pThr/pTyr-binding forkhead associated (FHA) protein
LNISRRHCLLAIDLPDLRVRDLGSKNGTYVNGEKIGQREAFLPAEKADRLDLPEHPLKEGDEIRLGDLVFRVSISEEAPEGRKGSTREVSDADVLGACCP